jgi:hypothetical protein
VWSGPLNDLLAPGAHPAGRVGARPAVLLLALLALGCATAGPSPTPSPPVDSGIAGRVLLGPTCPVEQVGQPPCVTPYAALLVVTDSEDREVARVTAAADGTFRIPLAPGDYVVVPQPGDPFPHAQPLDVTVVPGSFAEVEINYDTGIR